MEKELQNKIESLLIALRHSPECKKKMWFESEKTAVSTLYAPDTERWDTAVAFLPDGKWIVVEQYDSEEEAAKSHVKWCEKADDLKQVEDVLWDRLQAKR